MVVSMTAWAISIAAIVVLLAVDLFVTRKPHEVSVREATAWSVFYVAAAFAFAAWVWLEWGGDLATQYIGAYLVEKSLSVDNLFVFLVILQSFKVPRTQWHRVLLIGITVSLALRAAVILVGVALIERFIGTFIVFGLFLVWTAWKVAFAHEDDEIGERMDLGRKALFERGDESERGEESHERLRRFTADSLACNCTARSSAPCARRFPSA